MSEEGLISPVILCGGGGTRLWPLSRADRPKPFLPLIGDRTLFQRTVDRVSDPDHFAPPVIVAGAAHVDLIREQLPDGMRANIIVEPSARNTAPAIALAAHYLGEDAVMLVCPSDHFIANEDAFVDAASRAAALARHGWLTAFGIRATAPETGYGYIRRGKPIGTGATRIDQFVEKPDAARAARFVADGRHVWNGGLYCFDTGQLLAELARHRPEMAAGVAQSMAGATIVDDLVHPEPQVFADIAGESIDYALMENSDRGAMVSADMGWSDIGNWAAVAGHITTDEGGNHAEGQADLVDSRNIMVMSDGPRVSVLGCKDLVIVVDGDEILVTARDAAQKIGELPGVKG